MRNALGRWIGSIAVSAVAVAAFTGDAEACNKCRVPQGQQHYVGAQSYQQPYYGGHSYGGNNGYYGGQQGYGSYGGHGGYHHHNHDCCEPFWPQPAFAVRQVRVIYFSNSLNAWFESDAVVPPWGAVVGLSVNAQVPKVGSVRGWVVAVYGQPKMNSPYQTNVEEAGRIGEQVGSAGPRLSKEKKGTESVVGTVRLWSSKDGKKQVLGELLAVQDDFIIVRTMAGKIAKQSISTLSKSDVDFLGVTDDPATVMVSTL